MKDLDIVTIGRAGVDLYGDQTGSRLEDMGSFSKYIGGSPTNTAIGAARLGMRAALISRVGDDAMGRFITEELAREGVATSHVTTDASRMTALVILGIRDKEQFPLIFYRENCADMGISTDDIDEDLIARTRAVVTSGTHFSTANTKAASLRALGLAAQHGAQRWIDLDYRPVLWGLGSKGDGETRFIANATVTEHLQEIMPHLDVVVGTEEEIHIAGGSVDTITCLKTLRAVTDATFIVKLGPMGCAVFDGDIPDTVEGGLVVEGFPVEVFNVLGAGDAFMGGLLTGALEGRGWAEACRFANACGAFAVSRHACAPSYPSREELEHFIAHGSDHFRLREDAALERLHRNSTRQNDWPEVLAFAFDHRAQLEELSNDPERIADFKSLCASVALAAQNRHADRKLGILCDHRLGQDALDRLTGAGLWIGTPIELPGSR
ncbi:MAG: 5-dehydro-2-deoxygluconokinase, partial [Pseudomonadota bacterium]